MKKVVFILAIILSFIVVILSCKKQHDDSSQVNPTEQVTQTSQNIEQRILSFKSDIESRLKTGSGYPIDTAVWYTEALINYTYADVANNLEGLSIDSVYIDVDLSGGKVTPAEAASVYDAIIDSLTIQYDNLPSQNLHLVFADVFIRDSTAGSVTFCVFSGFSYGSPINYGTFGEEDFWKYGLRQENDGGYCDGPHEGENKYIDAAWQIEQRIRLNIGVPAQRHYAINELAVDIFPDFVYIHADPPGIYNHDFLNPHDEVPNDNLYDYLLLYKWSDYPNFNPCLCPEEMNFYWHGTEEVCIDLIYTVTYPYLGDRVLISVHQVGDHGYIIPPNPYPLYHELNNIYGTWVANPNEPGTFN